MANKLVIIEAPGKIKKFKQSLGSGYTVMASKGHIADLPEKGLNVDIKNDFAPTYKVYPEKKDVVKSIISEAKKSDVVYLMTDEDREGEAISWFISKELPKSVNVKRASTCEINKKAILKAIDEAGDINYDMVNSYEARRILDRLVGYKCSFITKQNTGGKSAGRVQSAGLILLANREKEIQAFVPIVYWPIEAELLTKDKHKVLATIKKPDKLKISTQEEAEKIIEVIKKGPVKVSKFEKKEVSIKPQAPFTTSTLYQSAASILGWKSDRTASVAQKLYSEGAITYHRTDSKYVNPEFNTELREYIVGEFGDKYLSSSTNVWSNKKGAQEAHEACRVTDVNLLAYNVGSIDEKRLYELVWKRTVASQASNMQSLRISAEFSCKKYVLAASGSKVLFDGWRKIWDYSDLVDSILPEMTVGDKVDVLDIKTERKETKPPARYNDRSFIKALEDSGIGRPSTYASIPKTLLSRGYIEGSKNITVTELGMRVADFLVNSEFCFADISFTAQMEEHLDLVASGKKTKLEVLTEFWTRLKSEIDHVKKKKEEQKLSEYDCPTCKEKGREAKLCLKHSRYGSFYSCQFYSDKENKCEYKADVGDNQEPVEKVKAELKESKIKCPNCDEKFLIRKSKKGNDYLGCRNWNKDKECGGFYTLEGEKMDFSKKKYKKKTKKKSKKSKKKDN